TSVTGHTLAILFLPYLYVPQRYVIYPVPILVVIGFPVAAGALPSAFRSLNPFPWLRPCATLSMTAALLLLLGGRGSDRNGLNVDYRDKSELITFLKSLPETALIAGWSPKEIIDSVPYLTGRSAFLTYETQNAYHKAYIDEMRKRMRALIDAVFATDPASLMNLRDNWGVTHLIVDLQHYQPSSPPPYFKPYDAWIEDALRRAREVGFEVPRQVHAATVFRQGGVVILDLRRLSVNSF